MIFLDDGYLDTYLHAIPILDELGIQCVLSVAYDLIGGHYKENAMMSWDQVIEASKKHMIACHGMSHNIITPENFKQEVLDAKAKLEDKVQRPVALFVFPQDVQLRDENLLRVMEETFAYIRPPRYERVYHLVGFDNPGGFKFFKHVDYFRNEVYKYYNETCKLRRTYD